MITSITIPVFLASDFNIESTTSTGGLVLSHKRNGEIYFVRKRETRAFFNVLSSKTGQIDYIAEIQEFTGKKGDKQVQKVLVPAPKFVTC